MSHVKLLSEIIKALNQSLAENIMCVIIHQRLEYSLGTAAQNLTHKMLSERNQANACGFCGWAFILGALRTLFLRF